VSEAARPAASASAPPIWLAAAHLAALWAFALVQPLFDLLGRNADFFVARGSTSGDIVAFAFGLVLVPPLALVGIEALAGLAGERARAIAHLVLVGLLVALIVLGFVREVGVSSWLLFPVAAAAGAGAALWYARESAVRRFATVLSAAPALFLALFLLTSQVQKLVIAGEAEAQVAQVDSRTPVVMVSFDEFPTTSLLGPDGRIDAGRYPNFAAFTRESTWFRDTTTVADGTRWATPVLLSGTLPERNALPTFQDYPQNLFTVLGGGYRLHVSEPVTRLCPKDLCADTGPREVEAGEAAGVAGPEAADDSFGERMGSMLSDLGLVSLHLVLPGDLRSRLPSVSETLGDFGEHEARPAPAALPPRRGGPAARRGRAALKRERRRLTELIPAAKEAERRNPALPRFLRQIRPYSGRGEPPLHYVHLLLPHHPWHYLPSGRTYGESRPPIPGLRDNVWGSDAVAVDQGWQRHLLQVGYVDRAVGRLMAHLRRTGLYDRALVVLAADHGVAFAPSSPRRKITRAGVGGIAPVPFFLKLPRQRRGRVVDEHVETVDVLPTIADALDVSLPRPSDGRSALADDFRGVDRVRVWSTTSTREFELLEVPMAEYRARRRELVARQAARFGVGASPLLWEVGPNRELIGRIVSASRPARSPAARARLDRPGDYAGVDPASAYAPSHVTGSVDRLPAGRDLAVAVNGRVEAVARTYEFAGRTRFSFMVPESAFREGANRVDVYEVRGRGRAARLARIPR
jgi:hypothetical protein